MFFINIVMLISISAQLIQFTNQNKASLHKTTRPVVDENGKHSLLVADMLLSPKQWEVMFIQKQQINVKYRKRDLLIGEEKKWPNGEIPIVFRKGDFSTIDRAKITQAFEKWSEHTCVKLRERRNDDTDFVEVINGVRCSSFVGRRGGKQILSLQKASCLLNGLPEHLFAHILGKYHEHMSYDRDQHITVNKSNIKSEKEHEFNRDFPKVDSFIQYDIASVVHYSSRFSSKNDEKTMTANDKNLQFMLDKQEKYISFYDIKAINWLYKCSSHCSSNIKCPPFGFLGTDCKCKCPGWLDKEALVVRPCTEEQITTGFSRTCYDRFEYCSSFFGFDVVGGCEKPTFAINCKLTCNLCENKPDPIFQDCKDKSGCIRERNLCNFRIQQYMCPVTCGLCTP